ncbi:MAG TPA: ABC transporter ATP-binding protein [Pyrinomonadaceae bacterium]|nr:ABC transporter ATP-binding protein [Pyrinomonadaceae bacterium]
MSSAAQNSASRSRDNANGLVAVSIERLSKTYPVAFLRLKKFLRRKFKPPVEALRDVSFNVHEGEIFGLIGPNGAGKTTLTKIIATLVQPTSGQVLVKGHDSVRNDQEVRRNVGLAGAEERSFYFRLTAEQNLLFFARLYGLNSLAAKRRINELLALLELEELRARRYAELSTGNKQRLSVARAMLANPPVLLLDEPTRSLDPIAAARMRALIKSLAQNDGQRTSVFLTSHNLAEVEELCDRVAIIGKGEIRALDTPQNLRALHTQNEQVSIDFTSLNAADAERALAQAFSDRFFSLDRSAREDECVVKFSREAGDKMLDGVLRVLQQSGAVICAVETERATLLDVLESYEQDGKGSEAQT